jgi:hypothetical protein
MWVYSDEGKFVNLSLAWSVELEPPLEGRQLLRAQFGPEEYKRLALFVNENDLIAALQAIRAELGKPDGFVNLHPNPPPPRPPVR